MEELEALMSLMSQVGVLLHMEEVTRDLDQIS